MSIAATAIPGGSTAWAGPSTDRLRAFPDWMDVSNRKGNVPDSMA